MTVTASLLAVLIYALTLCVQHADCVWTKFDLVRPFPEGWGSRGSTPFIKINSVTNNGPVVNETARFGAAVANIGDLDKDGIDDLVVGAPGEDLTYSSRELAINAGSIYVLFMNSNGSVKSHTRINGLTNGGPRSFNGDEFGFSLAGIGDLDGDSYPDIAVGAPGIIISSTYVLFMRPDGTVRSHNLIRGSFLSAPTPTSNVTSVNNITVTVDDVPRYIPNGPSIRFGVRFGSSMTALRDFNNDGVLDLAVGAADSSSGFPRIYFLYLYPNATVRNFTAVGPGLNGGPVLTNTFSGFGSSMVMLGDMNNDTIPDLAVGAKDLFEVGQLNFRSGVIYILFMNSNGSVKSYTRISERSGEERMVVLPALVCASHSHLFTLAYFNTTLSFLALRCLWVCYYEHR